MLKTARYTLIACATALLMAPPAAVRAADPLRVSADATTMRHKVMCGYQGWFRCPGDAAGLGWVHWSRDSKRIAPETLTFELWPDMTAYPTAERFAAPGFSYLAGRPAELFSSDNAATVLRHFQWMRDYGIDGAWLQRFVVGLPGGPVEQTYPSNWRVLQHVRAAASDWKKLVDEKITDDVRYLHEHRRPVVQIWGFYFHNRHNLMTAELGNRLVELFKMPGRYSAFLVGGGDWNWRANPDAQWQKLVRRFGAYCPWNVGNYLKDAAGAKHAATHYWAEDQRDCERRGTLWLPVVYPGFSWDNLQRLPPGTSCIGRRGGRFLWEQFHALSKLGADSVYVAMFDEVDEGTAIFKVTSGPPTQ
ncbi:MAG: glycoside hydrolase family 71/99-like protein, partial [Thermoguttaceae bacterium]